ncbi:MAG TPA: amidohydrolase family protein, partial [Dehalococcoidia bacterium]|nr:amidohydrolase family protein [Dehalococcoidia bacterium]
YTSLAFNLFWLEDAEFQEACFTVYNDWLAEFCSYAPDRLVGLGLISCFNIDNAVKELERCRKIGLRGAMIWCSPPDDRSYLGRYHDPFWAAAQDLDMPISLHILTGQGRESRGLSVNSQDNRLVRQCISSTEIARSIAEFIFGGTFERFSRLKIVSAENGIGWIPYFLQRAEAAWNRTRFLPGANADLSKSPTEFFRQNVFATFINDRVGIRNADFIGVDNIMWSSDYPHTASTFPHSLEVIERDFADVPEEWKVKICRDNAAKLYGFDLSTLTALPGTRVAAD